MLQYRKTRRKYQKLNDGDRQIAECTFCTSVRGERILQQNDTMFIVANRIAYDMFEGRRVLDHLMIIPKEHRVSLADFTDAERIDYVTLVGQYEQDGYNVYARGVNVAARSVKHQHTHLIKLSESASRIVVHTKKPYMLLDIK